MTNTDFLQSLYNDSKQSGRSTHVRTFKDIVVEYKLRGNTITIQKYDAEQENPIELNLSSLTKSEFVQKASEFLQALTTSPQPQ